jgi:hypothetical protein
MGVSDLLNPWYPLGRGLNGPNSRSGHRTTNSWSSREKNITFFINWEIVVKLGSWIPYDTFCFKYFTLVQYDVGYAECYGEGTEVPLNWQKSLSMQVFGNTLHLFGRLITASVDILRPHKEVLRLVRMVAVQTVSRLPTLVFACSHHFWYTSTNPTGVRQMPGCNSQRRGTAHTLPN